MFTAGQVLYCSPFYFKNGNTSKDKYFIILSVFENRVIIASLPTSSCKAPSLITEPHGCNNVSDRMFNCYAFAPEKVITDKGFSFPLPTFIYGNEVEDYDVNIIESVYKIEGIDYESKGVLLAAEMSAIVNCLKQSASMKRGIKKLL